MATTYTHGNTCRTCGEHIADPHQPWCEDLGPGRHMILAAIPTQADTTAIDVRNALGLPRTRFARERVEAALDALITQGLVQRERIAGMVTYRRTR